MGPVWALLLLLLPIAQGAESCNVTKNHTQCYGALDGSIQIRLRDNGSMIERWKWIKKGSTIFDWKNEEIKNDFQNRAEFFSNTGIFQLSNLSRNDTASYTLEYIAKNGKRSKIILHKLTIEAPVSSLELQHQCLSKGEVQVNWTSEGGDSPEFSCTLNGHNLTDSQLLPKNENNKTIILRQKTEGLLRCSVKNHVSEVYKELHISDCGYINCTLNGTQISDWVSKDNITLCSVPTTSAPITVGKTSALTPSTNQTVTPDPWYIRHKEVIAGAVAGVLFLGIAAIALVCVLKRKRKNNDEADQELTYADVRIIQQPGRRPQQQQASEVEVEYGQVKFSNQNQPVREAPGDACIYAKVRR